MHITILKKVILLINRLHSHKPYTTVEKKPVIKKNIKNITKDNNLLKYVLCTRKSIENNDFTIIYISID